MHSEIRHTSAPEKRFPTGRKTYPGYSDIREKQPVLMDVHEAVFPLKTAHHADHATSTSCQLVSYEQWPKSWLWMLYIWGIIIRSYTGVITSHYKDPYEPISIMERHKGFEHLVAHVVNVSSSKQPALLHWKINRGSKNHPLEKEIHLPNREFWVQNVNFPGCRGLWRDNDG